MISTWLSTRPSSGPPAESDILMEDSGNVLQEDGSNILTEVQ